jgi:hypothetical protein|tara:strand:- start:407 stop:514 length:108 start_codon:yes stop_codon:yes gene_type:complete
MSETTEAEVREGMGADLLAQLEKLNEDIANGLEVK